MPIHNRLGKYVVNFFEWDERMKKRWFLLICCMLCLIFPGCNSQKYERYRGEFYGTFDTVVTIVGYVQKERDFDRYLSYTQERFQYFHQLFDRYEAYTDVTNIKTINDNAGISPVKVSKDLFEFLEYCMTWCEKSQGQVNIALGPVMEIWHDYRERFENAAEGTLPPKEELEQANLLTDLQKVQLDEEAQTVFLTEKGMSLDVGALAKGYATEKVGEELFNMGFTSFSISGGGNVRTFSEPVDSERKKWNISIMNPNTAEDPNAEPIDFLYVNDLSVVTSGDYQRYYLADGKKIHHIIDPDSLYPADYYQSVTVITEDSGEADLLSTWLFTLPLEESKRAAQKAGVQALWVLQDNTVVYTDGYLAYSKNYGGATLN